MEVPHQFQLKQKDGRSEPDIDSVEHVMTPRKHTKGTRTALTTDFRADPAH